MNSYNTNFSLELTSKVRKGGQKLTANHKLTIKRNFQKPSLFLLSKTTVGRHRERSTHGRCLQKSVRWRCFSGCGRVPFLPVCCLQRQYFQRVDAVCIHPQSNPEPCSSARCQPQENFSTTETLFKCQTQQHATLTAPSRRLK